MVWVDPALMHKWNNFVIVEVFVQNCNGLFVSYFIPNRKIALWLYFAIKSLLSHSVFAGA